MHKVKCEDCGWTGGESKLKKPTSKGGSLSEYCPECGSTDIKDVIVEQIKKK